LLMGSKGTTRWPQGRPRRDLLVLLTSRRAFVSGCYNPQDCYHVSKVARMVVAGAFPQVVMAIHGSALRQTYGARQDAGMTYTPSSRRYA
jgi:hypothetical protein